MTDEQLNQRLSGIRRQADSLTGEGYTVFRSAVPSEACCDIRFLLNHIDGLNLRLADLQSKATGEKSHGKKVEPAMLTISRWLIHGKYRSVSHRHDGSYRAIDESENKEWNAAALVDLVELMGAKL